MRMPKQPRSPSHRLTVDDAVAIWILYMQGHFAQRIAARFDCNVGRVYEVLKEELHPGSRLQAAKQLEEADANLAAHLRTFVFKPVVTEPANDNQMDLFGDRDGYQPSVLRQFPCITFGARCDRVRAPLPSLILERVTSGIFYNVVGGGGTVRDDYGRRFERYCANYLRAMLPELNWRDELKYGAKGYELLSPDILLVIDSCIRVAIECKATRMSYGAKFGDGEVDERGYDEIIKAVFQLWRFFSHCRRGLTGLAVDLDAVGAVLTLDNWLQVANAQIADVLSAASDMAAAKDPEISDADKRPIAFFSVTSMEATLAKATAKSFVDAVRAAASSEYTGWLLSNVHERFLDDDQPTKSFPFHDDVGNVLPWWNMLRAELN